MFENKDLICEKLFDCLKATRRFDDLVHLRYEMYENGDEFVIAQFESGSTKAVNVTIDSGFSMIRDVVNNIC